jgi:hypothetical protein
MMDEDERKFHAYALSIGACFLDTRSSTPVPCKLPALSQINDRSDARCVWISSYGMLSSVVMAPTSGKDHWYVEREPSPVIQFVRSLVTNGKLFVGGLSVQLDMFLEVIPDRFYKEVMKPDELRLLYNSLAGWIRRNFKYDKARGAWCGPEAQKWLAEGGEHTYL